MKKNEKQYQQGDVLIRRITEMPKGEHKQLAKGRCILAHGESGNIHVIDVPETDAELIQIGERMLLNLKIAAPVKHGEHKPIHLEPGLYEIGRVREHDYLNDMVRTVVD